LYLENLIVHVNPEFSTSQDYMVAKIIANDRLEVYLKTEMDALSRKSSNLYWLQTNTLNNNLFHWTDSKTALV